jgi:protoheme IX farnesyltransferase
MPILSNERLYPMKFSLGSSFSRLALVLLVSVLLLTISGGAAEAIGLAPACAGWPFCVPATMSGWLKLVHVLLAGVAGIVVTLLFVRAWNEHRANRLVLPLTTVTTILFFGQAFVGAMQVYRGFPLHLIVLHAATAVSLWISLVALVMSSAVLSRTRTERGAGATVVTSRRLTDFLVLGKPWIVALLLLTTFGVLVAGAKAWPSPILALWTLAGGALAAGGSSALNQYIDRELDQKMQRTARRPIPSGRLTPAEGLSYGLALCLTSYYVLACLVNFTAALLSLAGIFYYVVLYSLILKRATVQNIVIGGGAGAIPPMVGWAAATGHLSLTAWILFLIIFMWTPPHFWALAIVRSKDYEKAGIPMLPVVRGDRATRAQILLYTVLLVGATFLLPLTRATGMIFVISSVLLGVALLGAAWRVWRVPGNKVAWTMYRWSSLYLMLIFVALVADAIV